MNILRRHIVPSILFALVGVSGSFAQAAGDPVPSKPEFMSRYDFHITISALSSSDPRFSWDGKVGGNMDLVDYVKGRLSLFAEYDVVMGNELRPFDPNQGNYTFEGSSSFRFHGTEFAGVFHHLSRHLSDRFKTAPVAINSLEGRVLRQVKARAVSLELRGTAGKIVQHSFLDYTWRGETEATARVPLNGFAGWYGRVSTETFGVDKSLAARGSQTGGRLESGVRFDGKNGALELFAGWEHRIDAHPLERNAMSWAFAGFRLASR